MTTPRTDLNFRMAGACFLVGLVVATTGACGTAAPAAPTATPAPVAAPSVSALVAEGGAQPQFAAPAAAKAALVGTLVTIAPSRMVADLDALSQRLGLPVLLGHELLSSLGGMELAGGSGQFQQLWERVDATAPMAVVWVLPQGSPAKGYCAAVTFKDRVLAKRTLDELGRPGEQRHGIVERVTASGDKLWGGIRGRTLFVSESADALLFAGGLAQESAQIPPGKGQVVLTVLPKALAAASGKTSEALVAQLSSMMAGETSAVPGKTAPALQRLVAAMSEAGARLVLDSTAVKLVFDVGPRDGVMIQAEIAPSAGSEFAERVAHRTPYQFDTRLPIKNDGTAVFAIGDWSAWLGMVAKVFESTGPAGQAMWKDTSKMIGLTSEWSCVVDSTEVGLSTLCSSPLKPGASGTVALDAAVAAMTSQNAWEAVLDGRKPSALKIKRTRDAVEIEKKIENKEPTARALAKAVAGGDTLKYALAVRDGRLLMVAGRDGRKAFSRFGAGGAMAGAPLVAAGLARTQGDELFASIDVLSFVLRVLGQGQDLPGKEMATMAGAMPGVAEMVAPFTFSVRGGNALQGEFAIPLGSLDSIAKVVRGMLGAVGGPPSK